MNNIFGKEIYKVFFDKKVLKFLKRHKGQKIYSNFWQSLEILKINPYKNNLDIKTMKGKFNIYRIRLGKYRIIYEVIDSKLLIILIDADKRGDIYK